MVLEGFRGFLGLGIDNGVTNHHQKNNYSKYPDPITTCIKCQGRELSKVRVWGFGFGVVELGVRV